MEVVMNLSWCPGRPEALVLVAGSPRVRWRMSIRP